VLELAVFLFLLVPPMILSFFVTDEGGVAFPLVAVSTIARDLALVALIAFFVHTTGEPLHAIGWDRGSLRREVAVGAALFPALYLTSFVVDAALRSEGLSGPRTPQPQLVPVRDAGQLLLAMVLVAVVAFSEETIFRGYLMRRLEQATGSASAALVLSAAVFALGHAYEGASGVITVGLLGVGFGLVYRWRRSIIAPASIHFLLDLTSIVVLPLLLR
jgi:membrane protease YdiL (CAAX protease family)